jgi:hypothetical protein
MAALERAKEEQGAHGVIESEYPGYLVQDTNIKGEGSLCQHTFIDTSTKATFCMLSDSGSGGYAQQGGHSVFRFPPGAIGADTECLGQS